MRKERRGKVKPELIIPEPRKPFIKKLTLNILIKMERLLKKRKMKYKLRMSALAIFLILESQSLMKC